MEMKGKPPTVETDPIVGMTGLTPAEGICVPDPTKGIVQQVPLVGMMGLKHES